MQKYKQLKSKIAKIEFQSNQSKKKPNILRKKIDLKIFIDSREFFSNLRFCTNILRKIIDLTKIYILSLKPKYWIGFEKYF